MTFMFCRVCATLGNDLSLNTMTRKINITITQQVLVVADEGIDLEEAVQEFVVGAGSSHIEGADFDVLEHDYEVTDSR